ncbi:hypothetical protein ACHAXS_001035 [Conticribra weissflogii]
MQAPAGVTAVPLQGDSGQGLARMETCGNITIEGFCKTLMTAVFDVWVADPNEQTYGKKSCTSFSVGRMGEGEEICGAMPGSVAALYPTPVLSSQHAKEGNSVLPWLWRQR